MRGRHRIAKQRSISRGSTVLGVAAIAVVGAGGAATASDTSPIPISLPDLLPVGDIPGFGDLVSSDDADDASATAATEARTEAAFQAVSSDAGEVLRARVVAQANAQQEANQAAIRDKVAKEASVQAAKDAAAQKVRDDAKSKAAAAVAKEKAAAADAARVEAERLAKIAASYTKPVASYTLTASFGQGGSLWANDHTGQDFAAPTGTPAVAVHSGEITSAGWAGSYGYRIILTLDDGTEIWYCHLSSMVKTSGQVSTGETIARVGATGNVTGPHLHLEVRPGGGDPINPVSWFSDRGITV